jgi:ABC-type nickel/cobalt efflux system permease component RcnA
LSIRAKATPVAVAVWLCFVAWSVAAWGHPAGFSSINRYIGVECSDERGVRLAYLLDFAELPSYAEIEQLDTNHDGNVTPEEQRAYLDARLAPLVAGWAVEVNGARASPRVTGSSLAVLEGERGLSTVRISAEVGLDGVGVRDAGGGEVRVHVVDRSFAEAPGWREMAAADSETWGVVSGRREGRVEALSYSRGGEPPRVDEASFTLSRAKAGVAPASVAPPAAPPSIDPRLVAVSRAVREAARSGSFPVMALWLALLMGAAHALSPGHGKALAAAYLVGSRARAWHAVVLGVVVIVAHTVAVFALGLLAVGVERAIGSGRLMRWVDVLAAVTVIVVGAAQVGRAWRGATGSFHTHAHVTTDGGGAPLRSVLALGASVGVTPCPSALVLLLAAVSLHRVGLGLVLVAAFAAGGAVTLTVIGAIVVAARRVVERASFAGPALRWIPVVSSIGVLVLGVLLLASALSPGRAGDGSQSARRDRYGSGGVSAIASTSTRAPFGRAETCTVARAGSTARKRLP